MLKETTQQKATLEETKSELASLRGERETLLQELDLSKKEVSIFRSRAEKSESQNQRFQDQIAASLQTAAVYKERVAGLVEENALLLEKQIRLTKLVQSGREETRQGIFHASQSTSNYESAYLPFHTR